ncbi:MAG: hypothetical protein ACH350_00530 [Parachlamydiaceae bacterium]
MANLLGGIGGSLHTVSMNFASSGVQVKKGVLALGEGVSRVLHDVYSMQGFEKTGKTVIANMRLASLIIPQCGGVFSDCIKTLEAQKELIYATLVFDSTLDFIKVTQEANGKKTYRFQLPKDSKGKIDIQKLLYGIANPLDTLYFLKKYQVYSFPFISKIGAQLGAVKLFTLGGETWKFSHIPVLNSLTKKPKELFVFIASVLAVHKSLEHPKFREVEYLLKLTGNIGKIVLISSAEYMAKNHFFIGLSLVDVITQNSGLIAYMMKRSQERESRFNHPV